MTLTATDYTARAARMWNTLDANGQAGIRFGMFPFGPMKAAEAEGYDGRRLCVALMKHARVREPPTTRRPVDISTEPAPLRELAEELAGVALPCDGMTSAQQISDALDQVTGPAQWQFTRKLFYLVEKARRLVGRP